MSPARRTARDAWGAIMLLLLCSPTAVHAQDRLLPQSRRITDEAIARDRALISDWRTRAEALDTAQAWSYPRTRAGELLAFVLHEYDRNNRNPVVDSAFAEAVDLASALERGTTPAVSPSAPDGVDSLAPGLWRRLDSLRAADVDGCAGAPVARAQVQLLHAVVEADAGGRAWATPWVIRAEALAAEAEGRSGQCRKAAADTSTPGPAVPPAPPPVPEPQYLEGPDAVHFAFDRADLAPASERAIDELAELLRTAPDLSVRLDAFTDPLGGEAYNKRLARRRGDAVRTRLVHQGIGVDRITVVPHGEGSTQPEGASAWEQHALDRRVEFTIEGPGSERVRLRRQREDVQVTPDRRPARERRRATSH